MTNTSVSPSSLRLPAIDGLRGVAALLILFGHYAGIATMADYGTPIWFVKRALWLNGSGVDLFFVLSGFLIGGILIDHRESPNLLRVFWIRRATRILPLFALYLAVFSWLCRYPNPPLLVANSQPLWCHALFLSNIWTAFAEKLDASFLSNTWSLAVEEQFYLLLPLVVLFSAPRRLSRWALVTLAAVPLLRLVAWSLSAHDISLAAHNLMPCRADTFAVGVFLATEFRQPVPFWSRLPLRYLVVAGALPGLILFWLTRRNEWMGSLIYCAVGYTSCALFYGWCVMLTLASARCSTLFSFRPLVWVGRHSYFIYLFQGIIPTVIGFFVAAWFPEARPANATMLSATIGTLIVCASISMRYFEAPLQRWGRRHAFMAPAC